ncbi:hypothetical protein HK097_011491, partial [Rhizophlyctis rosea]
GGVEVFERVWSESVGVRGRLVKKGKKRKAGNGVEGGNGSDGALPFPFPRTPYAARWIDGRFGKSVMLPIPGLATSFLTQSVECDVMRPHPHPDYFPVILLSELLSRTEGPLYTAIRGQGYAYDATLHLSLWTGQLSFELNDSSEPYKAYVAFQDILDKLQNEEEFGRVCGDFELETARASVAYKYACGRSTGVGIVGSALRAVLRGYASLEEEEAHQAVLYRVTREDLKRVYEKYFRRFCDNSRLTIITTPPGKAVKRIREEFASGLGHSCLKFREIKLQDLAAGSTGSGSGGSKKGKGKPGKSSRDSGGRDVAGTAAAFPALIGTKELKDSREIEAFIDSVDTFLLDCDGVIWASYVVYDGVAETLDYLRSKGKRILFVTNNSTKSRPAYVKLFQSLGLNTSVDEIFSSAYAAAYYLSHNLHFPKSKKVYVIGMAGVKDELASEGIGSVGGQDDNDNLEDMADIGTIKDDPDVGAVLVGFDLNINYKKLAKAFTYLKSGEVEFLATNMDMADPGGGRIYPGLGLVFLESFGKWSDE